MSDLLNRDGVAWIVSTILGQAKTAIDEYDAQKDDFFQGRMLAYYELLDAIKSRIQVREGNPDEYGLGINIENLEEEMKKRQ